jgi:hypothetical protein
VRANLTLPWKPELVIETRLMLGMVFQLDPPENPREGNISGAAVGASAFVNIAASVFTNDAAELSPTGSSAKRVAAAEDSLAHHAHIAATAGEPVRHRGRAVWLAVAPGKLAMANRAAEVRWSSDSGELADVRPTDVGLRIDFRDHSVQVITTSAWTRRRIIRAWRQPES